MAGGSKPNTKGAKGELDTKPTADENGTNTRTKTTTAGGAGTTTGAGTGNTDTGTAKEKELLGVASVNESPVPKPSTPTKPKRKRVQKKKAKNDETFNAEQITMLLMTMSTIMSNSERGAIFALTEIECKQLAEPIANIIANNDSMKELAKHSDSVALATACFMIFAPKIFVWLQYEKAHRKPKGIEVKTVKGVKGNAERKINGSSGTDNSGGASSVSENDSSNVLTDLPSIM